MQSWAEDQIFRKSKLQLHLKHPTRRAPGSGALSATAWEHDAPATWVPRNPPRAVPERKAASPHEVDRKESSLEFFLPDGIFIFPLNPLIERLISGESNKMKLPCDGNAKRLGSKKYLAAFHLHGQTS